jgi:hypothetical protein
MHAEAAASRDNESARPEEAVVAVLLPADGALTSALEALGALGGGQASVGVATWNLQDGTQVTRGFAVLAEDAAGQLREELANRGLVLLAGHYAHEDAGGALNLLRLAEPARAVFGEPVARSYLLQHQNRPLHEVQQ